MKNIVQALLGVISWQEVLSYVLDHALGEVKGQTAYAEILPIINLFLGGASSAAGQVVGQIQTSSPAPALVRAAPPAGQPSVQIRPALTMANPPPAAMTGIGPTTPDTAAAPQLRPAPVMAPAAVPPAAAPAVRTNPFNTTGQIWPGQKN